MKLLAAALLFPAALISTPSAPRVEAGKRLPVHVGGRTVSEGAALRFGWPGVYLEGRFKGRDVRLAYDTDADHFRVLIDGRLFQTLTKPGRTEIKIGNLSPGNHVVRIERLTESQSGSTRFLGFFTSGTPLPAAARRSQIEFIGDSHTVGYGDTLNRASCSEQEVHDSTDTQKAFGPLLARGMDADYRLIAFSGRGVVRNYSGIAAGEPLPFLYPRAIPGEAGAYRGDASWRPRTIVINLGTNDFSTPLHKGEAWADDAALRADYRARYIAFVRARKAAQPQARIVLMAPESFAADVAAVAAATGVTLVRLGKLEKTGCNGHPSLADHRAMADQLRRVLTLPR